MREYKFRAWHKGDWANKPQMIFDEKQGDCLVWKSQGQPITVMQYTGLKDKNGKEIYEGDLIQDNLGYGAVEYRETRAGFRLNYVDGLAKWFLDYTDDEFKTIEVIGNIYQTPAEVNP